MYTPTKIFHSKIIIAFLSLCLFVPSQGILINQNSSCFSQGEKDALSPQAFLEVKKGSSYEKFQNWLENISEDTLKNTITLLDALEILVKGLSDENSSVHKANASALTALITVGLVTKEEVKENNILLTIMKGLSDEDNIVREVNAGTLTALISAELVTKEEAIKEVKVKNVLPVIVKGLSDENSSVCRDNASVVLPTLLYIWKFFS